MYILVTPARNEESNLPDVIETVIKQTIKPKLWVIVDDGSTDETASIIERFEDGHNWITHIKLPPHPRDITFHYSYVCKAGFDYAIKYCLDNCIDYEYIALLDADTLLEERYIGKIINEFDKDEELGIASGGVYYIKNEKLQLEKSIENLPRGTGRLWRKKCFLETGGYLIEPSPDALSNVKAVLNDWKIRQFKDIVQIQKRKTASAEGLWSGYKTKGLLSHYRNEHPLLVLLNTVYFTSKRPYYPGMAFISGYLTSLVKRKEKIDDEEIKNYYWNTRLKEVASYYWQKLGL